MSFESKPQREGYIEIDLILFEKNISEKDDDSVIFIGESQISPKKSENKDNIDNLKKLDKNENIDKFKKDIFTNEKINNLKKLDNSKNIFKAQDIISSNDLLPIVDPALEYLDPNPDIHNLFIRFSHEFFYDNLKTVEVKWSKKMTNCAGLCKYTPREGYCVISLSLPLLQFRPRKDLVETLLHEMIHAFLFVNFRDRDRDGHGPRFTSHMNRINKSAGTNITIYHRFFDEVKYHKKHWWRCDGPCRDRKPYYGYCKRSMNRAPGPNDSWWSDHQKNCPGKFIKIKEPEKPVKKQKPVFKTLDSYI